MERSIISAFTPSTMRHNPLDRWLKLRATTDDATLTALRDRAAVWLQESAFPTTRDEEWRFTDLSALLTVEPEIAPSVALTTIPSLCTEAVTRLVFVNGRYCATASTVDGLPANQSPHLTDTALNQSSKVFIGTWSQASMTVRDRLTPAIAAQTNASKPFSVLNAASVDELGVIWLGAGAVVETPIAITHVVTARDAATLAQTRLVIVAEANSCATIVEEFVTLDQGTGSIVNNAVIDLHLGQNAELTHITVQQASTQTYHFQTIDVTQAQDSRYAHHALTTGAALSRQEIAVAQTGSGTATTLNGLTTIGGSQVADTHTTVNLSHPHSTINQLCKCIADAQARSVFDGRIQVSQLAQQTRAAQLNRNLLLSSQARVNTKPQLEIVADDVQCSHGATVSQLEADELFYLQSRGLDRTTSEALLIDAFAAEILEAIPVESVRSAIAAQISTRGAS